MSDWISVKDQLPPDKQIVLGHTPIDGHTFIGFYQKDPCNENRLGCKRKEWYLITAMRSTQKITKRVSHWMPLPNPPQSE